MTMMLIDNEFSIGETVYLRTDAEQEPRIVTKLLVSPLGVTYCLSLGERDTCHYAVEITRERDTLKAITSKTA